MNLPGFACVRACVCVRPFTVKASSVWISWTAREQINDVVLKTFVFSAKFLRRYFRMKHLTFLINHFILFTHQKRAEPRLNQRASRFQNMRPSATIIRHRLRSALHRETICLTMRSCLTISTWEKACNLTRKVTANFSMGFSPWHNT